VNGSCCETSNVRLLSCDEASDRLLAAARPLTETEPVATEKALGRVLASAISSRVDVPPWDNSAMDGYALATRDLATIPARLPISQRIPAGAVAETLAPGTAARIFTGAPIPSGADAVVIQEVCEARGESVEVRASVRPGENIRRAGEDLRCNQEVIAAGVRLQPQHLGLAASVGTAELPVFRRLRVAVLSTGDELAMPGEPLGPGQIYNSNRFTLQGMIEGLGCECIQLGIVEDTLDATVAAFARAARDSDLIIATGGVSVGEEDHVRGAVERLGALEMWRIAIRPGKPTAFGHVGDVPFLGLPGNPVSVFVTFCIFASPYIRRLQGEIGDLRPISIPVAAAFDWPRPDKRREYVRARLVHSPEGAAAVEVYPSRSSGVLSSVTWANGLALIPEGRVVREGDIVEFIPFSELLQ